MYPPQEKYNFLLFPFISSSYYFRNLVKKTVSASAQIIYMVIMPMGIGSGVPRVGTDEHAPLGKGN